MFEKLMKNKGKFSFLCEILMDFSKKNLVENKI